MKSHVLSVSCKWCEIFMFFHIIIPSPHFAGACWVNTWYSLNHICSIISVKLLNEPSISLFHSRSLFLAYANQKCIHKFSTHTHTHKQESIERSHETVLSSNNLLFHRSYHHNYFASCVSIYFGSCFHHRIISVCFRNLSFETEMHTMVQSWVKDKSS